MSNSRRRILVFAKAPQPGDVKTRLQSCLSPFDCAQLHRSLTAHTLQVVCDSELAPVELWCTPTTEHPFFLECVELFPVRLQLQDGGDLGARMKRAFRGTLTACEHVLIVGTDCAVLDRAYLLSAFDALQSGDDVVLGPAEDGGYVLIGANRIHDALFGKIDWGSDQVLCQTREVLKELRWSWSELEPLWDIDRPADFSRLLKIPPWGSLCSSFTEKTVNRSYQV